MTETNVKSKKSNLGKVVLIAWVVLAVLLVALVVRAWSAYASYKEVQDAAVSLVRMTTDQFEDEAGDYNTMVESMYSFFNPTLIDYVIDGERIDNSEVVKAANEADTELGRALTEQGYSAYSGSYYLRCTSFLDYTRVYGSFVPFIIWVVLALGALAITIVYILNKKKQAK